MVPSTQTVLELVLRATDVLNNIFQNQNVFLYLIFFLQGILLGSFLNVLIDRLPSGRGFVVGRSYCENCKKTLKAYDLIPIFSFIVLRGKCRFCKMPISYRLLVVELLIGTLAMCLLFQTLTGSIGVIYAVLIFLMLYSFIGIFVADIIYGIIPDLLVATSLVSTFLYILNSNLPLLPHLLSAIGSFLFFFLLFAFTRGKGMGFGDVKLAFVLGLLLGFPLIIISLYLAFLTGALISIILVLCRKLRFFGSTIPFGPFLIASTIVTFFYGDQIYRSFISRFFQIGT